jgi:D-alanyl-lipoteichoic acid acyltransferase DltB (MBOAT superfamily)
MIFNTPLFYFFFVAFLGLYGLVLLRRKPKVYLIVLASLVFYGAWNWRFIPLLVGSGLADYYIALAIGRTEDERARKRWLILSIAINLGILGLFKYADFVLVSVADFLGFFGVQADLPTLSWVLPVGISFYTFQSLSYTIDVYRRDMEPREGLMEFLAALSFFPQLVAGPILRARQIVPQMHELPVPTWEEAKHGFVLITAGVLKKTMADLLAAPVAVAFDAAGPVSRLETWTGVLAFAGQIYGDFAGYTDMAIGLALLLGFKIPLNFALPYFAVSPVDFWRRWHISLSTWLRDYLYIPLGGNRRGGRFRNVMITMFLGGLWHGAAWTFVVWGVFHGLLISATHGVRKVSALSAFHEKPSRRARLVTWAVTFYLVLIGWVLFRAPTLGAAFGMLGSMHGLGPELPAAGDKALVVLQLVLAALVLMHGLDFLVLRYRRKPAPERRPGRLQTVLRWSRAFGFWFLLVFGQALCLLIGEPSNEFIYFQF